mgnify:CR=1 FL=1
MCPCKHVDEVITKICNGKTRLKHMRSVARFFTFTLTLHTYLYFNFYKGYKESNWQNQIL